MMSTVSRSYSEVLEERLASSPHQVSDQDFVLKRSAEGKSELRGDLLRDVCWGSGCTHSAASGFPSEESFRKRLNQSESEGVNSMPAIHYVCKWFCTERTSVLEEPLSTRWTSNWILQTQLKAAHVRRQHVSSQSEGKLLLHEWAEWPAWGGVRTWSEPQPCRKHTNTPHLTQTKWTDQCRFEAENMAEGRRPMTAWGVWDGGRES